MGVDKTKGLLPLKCPQVEILILEHHPDETDLSFYHLYRHRGDADLWSSPEMSMSRRYRSGAFPTNQNEKKSFLTVMSLSSRLRMTRARGSPRIDPGVVLTAVF